MPSTCTMGRSLLPVSTTREAGLRAPPTPATPRLGVTGRVPSRIGTAAAPPCQWPEAPSSQDLAGIPLHPRRLPAQAVSASAEDNAIGAAGAFCEADEFVDGTPQSSQSGLGSGRRRVSSNCWSSSGGPLSSSV